MKGIFCLGITLNLNRQNIPLSKSLLCVKKLMIVSFLIFVLFTHAAAQKIEFKSSSSIGKEDMTTVVMELSRSKPHDDYSSVSYTVTGTATGAGVDYILASGSVVFQPKDKNNKDIVAIIVDDLLYEPNETIIVTLTNPVNATLGGKSTHTYTIEDNDDMDNGIVSLSCYPEEATDGNNVEILVEMANNPLPVSAFGLDIVYDQTECVFHEVVPGSLNGNWSKIETSQEAPGRIKIVAQAGSGSSISELSNGSIIAIGFQINCLDLPGDKEVFFAIENFIYDLEDNFIPESAEAGMTIKLCQGLGDVNGDGNVTPGDSQMAFAIFLGQVSPNFCQGTITDTNCNDSISPGDAQVIFNHFLGKNTLPECCAEYAGLSSLKGYLSVFAQGMRSYANRTIFPLTTLAQPGKIIAIPVIITQSRGIHSFSLDLAYPSETLTYLGLKRSQMTKSFEHVNGIPLANGYIRIEGETENPIDEKGLGSLAILYFKLSNDSPRQVSLEILRVDGDISDAEMGEGVLIQQDKYSEGMNFLSFGDAIVLADSTVRVPVLINQSSGIQAFGMDFEFSHDKLEFAGVEPVGVAGDFLVVEGNLIDKGRMRFGGFNISPLVASPGSVLCELVFRMKERGGIVKIVDLVDDIKNSIVVKKEIIIE
ncbi:cohesin domain-containing protein [Acidobacteriota bacterium]